MNTDELVREEYPSGYRCHKLLGSATEMRTCDALTRFVVIRRASDPAESEPQMAPIWCPACDVP